MKYLALFFLVICFVCTACENYQNSKFFQDNDGVFTTEEVTKSRDLTQYEQGGLFWGRTRFSGKFGNEPDRLDGEKKVRNFIWQHWTEKKRGYIKFIFADTDTSHTTHYFIEPNEKGEWIVSKKGIHQLSNGKFNLTEDILNSVERLENK